MLHQVPVHLRARRVWHPVPVKYTAQSSDEGSYSISASYGGDSYHAGSSTTSSSSLTVTTGTSAAISCTPSSISYNGGQTICTITVTSDDSSDSQPITGSVTLTGLPGDTSSTSCVLSGKAGVSFLFGNLQSFIE